MIAIWIGYGIILVLGILLFIRMGKLFRLYEKQSEVIKKTEYAIVRQVQQLPVESWKDAEKWGIPSRELSRRMISILEALIPPGNSARSNGGERSKGIKGGDPNVGTDVEEIIRSADTGTHRDAVLQRVYERIAIIIQLIKTHYPFPANSNEEDPTALLPWSATTPWWLLFSISAAVLLIALAVDWAIDPQALSTLLLEITGGLLLTIAISVMYWRQRGRVFETAAHLFRRVKNLEQYAAIPFQDRVQMDMSLNLLDGISKYGTELTTTIDRHKQAVDAIPVHLSGVVSEQVRDGLDPIRSDISSLRDRIGDSYENISAAFTETAARFVTLVDRFDFDLYQDWENTLKDASIQFNTLTTTITKYQTQTEAYYKELQQLTKQMRDNQEAVQKSYHQIAASVEERSTNEVIAKEELKNAIQNQMDMLLEEQRNFNDCVNQLSQEVKKSEKFYQNIAEGLPRLFSEISGVTESLRNTSQTVQTTSSTVKDALSRLKEQSEASIQALNKQTELAITSLSQLASKSFAETNTQREEYFHRIEAETSALINQIKSQSNGYDKQQKTYLDALSANIKNFNQVLNQDVEQLSVQVNGYSKALEAYSSEMENNNMALQDAYQTAYKQTAQNLDLYLKKLSDYTAKNKQPSSWVTWILLGLILAVQILTFLLK